MGDEKWGIQSPLKVSRPKGSGSSLEPGKGPVIAKADEELQFDEKGMYIPRFQKNKHRKDSHKVTMHYGKKRK